MDNGRYCLWMDPLTVRILPGESEPWTRPLRTLLAGGMIAIILLASTALIGRDYWRARQRALANAEASVGAFSQLLLDRFDALSADAASPLVLIATLDTFLEPPTERLDDKIAVGRASLVRSPRLDGVRVGYPDGSFFHVVNLDFEAWRNELQAPDDATIAIRVLGPVGPDRGHRITFLGPDGKVVGRRQLPPSDYDPRARPWYQLAVGQAQPRSIGPYGMVFTHRLGMTLAEALRSDKQIVAGADVVLDTVADFLAHNRVTPGAMTFIADPDGKVVIHSDPEVMKRLLGAAGSGANGSEGVTQAVVADHLSDTGTAFEMVDGREYLIRVMPIEEALLLRGHRIFVVAPTAELLADANRGLRQDLAISAAIVAIAVGVAILISGWITRSLLVLTAGAHQLQNLDFKTAIAVPSHVREISTLGAALNRARDAIFAFALYVPKEFVRRGIEAGQLTGRSGRRQEVTVMFTDIYDFTTISEDQSPEEVVSQLSEYFDVMSEVVTAYNGTIIQFIGDSVFAMWNAPLAEERHAELCCLCALTIERRLADFNATQAQRGLPAFHTRFGIHTGQAVVGSVGAAERLQYTAMGDTVNLASRLEGMNKGFGTTILASGVTVAAAAGRVRFRGLGFAQAKGRAARVEVHEVIGSVEPPEAGDAKPVEDCSGKQAK